ncbi:MAG: AsmA-like C-terminal domain-containing protein [Planctomycetes bacterium]|nr:AsmA-like C-terminal domain-containing protein [Planctomycetota bacterium]
MKATGHHEPADERPEVPRKAKRRLLKRLGLVFAAATVLSLALAALLPLYSDLFRPLLVRSIGEAIGRSVSLGELRVNLVHSRVCLNSLSIRDEDGKEDILSLGEAEVDVSIWPLLFGRIDVQSVRLRGVSASIVVDKEGKSNFQSILDRLRAGERGKTPQELPKVSAELHVSDAECRFSDQRMGVAFTMRGLDFECRADDLENIRYQLQCGAVEFQADGEERPSASFVADLRGTASLVVVEGQPSVSARGKFRLDNARLHGVGSTDTDEGSVRLDYDVSLNAARGALQIKKATLESDYALCTLSELYIGGLDKLHELVDTSSPTAGPTTTNAAKLGVQDWRGQLDLKVDLSRINADLGNTIGAATGSLVEQLGGELEFHAELTSRSASTLTFSNWIKGSNLSVEGQLQPTDSHAARPYGIRVNEVSEKTEIMFDLAEMRCSANGALSVTGPAGEDYPPGLLSIRLDLADQDFRVGRAPSVGVGALKIRLAVDLGALSRVTNDIRRALGFLPQYADIRGTVHQEFEVSGPLDRLSIRGRGRVEDMVASVPSGPARPASAGDVVVDGFEWFNDVMVCVSEGKLRRIEFGGAPPNMTLGVRSPALKLGISGAIGEIQADPPDCRFENVALDVELARLPNCILDRLRQTGPGLDVTGRIRGNLTLGGRLNALEISENLDYAGTVTVKGGREPLDGNTLPIDLGIQSSHAMIIEGVASLLTGEEQQELTAALGVGADSAPLVRILHGDETVVETYLAGVVRNRGRSIDIPSLQLRTIVRGAPLQRAVPVDVVAAGDNTIRRALTQDLSLGGEAVLTIKAEGSTQREIRMDTEIDMTKLTLRWKNAERQVLVDKQPEVPLGLRAALAYGSDGGSSRLVVQTLDARVGDVVVKGSLQVDEHLSLSGVQTAHGGYLRIPLTDLKSLVRTVPLLAKMVSADSTLELACEELAGNWFEGTLRGKLNASVVIPELSIPELAQEQQPAKPTVGKVIILEPHKPAPLRLNEATHRMLQNLELDVGLTVGKAVLDESSRLKDVEFRALFNNARHDNHLALTVRANAHSDKANSGRVELALEGNFDSGIVRDFDLSGRILDGPLIGTRLSGWVQPVELGSLPTLHAQILMPRLDVDSSLIDMLPEQYAALARKFAVRGTLKGEGVVTLGDDGKLSYSMGFRCFDVGCESEMPPLSVGAVAASVHIDEQRVQCGSFAGRMWDGAISGNAILHFPRELLAPPTFECHLDLDGASLKRIAAKLGDKASNISGRMAVFLDVRGDIENMGSVKGRGTVEIREARLSELPLVAGLVNLFSLSLPKKTVFDKVDISFQISGGAVRFSQILLSSDAIEIAGTGEVSLDGEANLVMAVATSERKRKGIPILSDALTLVVRGLQQTILPPVHVTGRISEPTFKVMAMEPITKPLKSIIGLIPFLPKPEKKGEVEVEW